MTNVETLGIVSKAVSLGKVAAIIRRREEVKSVSGLEIVVVLTGGDEEERLSSQRFPFKAVWITEDKLKEELKKGNKPFSEIILNGEMIFGDPGAPGWVKKVRTEKYGRDKIGYLQRLRRYVRKSRRKKPQRKHRK